MPDYLQAIAIAMIAWVASWLIAAFFADRPEKRSRGFLVSVAVLAAGIVLARRFVPPFHDFALWHPSEAVGWAMFAVALAGLAFAWWARLELGRLWSGTITLKPGHRIVDTGPYAIVRHPIYTGLLLAVLAAVAAFGHALGLVAGGIVVVVNFIKARMEERFLSRELGEEAYAAYRRRVPMLIPFVHI